MQRRTFLQGGLAASAAVVALPALRTAAQAPSEQIHVALIGAGDQGRTLLNAAAGIPGLRFRAVCDIWKYRRKSAKYLLETYKHDPAEYDDYRELLAKEKDLQAAIVATPDFLHAEQTNACLQAGLHVYCEKSMSNSLDAARSMVRTMRATGRRLQIGYQRRSNPRYLYAQKLPTHNLLGRITHVGGQCCHAVREDLGWPKRQAIPDDMLKQYGYASMHELRNWRSYTRYGGGPFADLGAHLVDAIDGLLKVQPRSILAGGGCDFYQGRQWYDNAMAIIEYPLSSGTVRGSFQVLTTTSGGGNWEQLLGTEASLRLSETARWNKVYREPHAPDWEPWVRQGLVVKDSAATAAPPTPQAKPAQAEDPNEVHVRETGQVIGYDLPVTADKPPHQPHLENFFDAVRGRAELACPADVAFRTEVVVHKVHEAIQARRMIDLRPEDFSA